MGELCVDELDNERRNTYNAAGIYLMYLCPYQLILLGYEPLPNIGDSAILIHDKLG
jgi:hypothetical protein